MIVLDQFASNPYLRATFIVLVVFVGLRLFLFLLEKIILKLTLKTKNNLDDKFVKKTSKPFTLFVLLVGLRVALEELPLSTESNLILGKIVTSIIIFIVAYIAYLFVDIVLLVVLKKKINSNNSTTRESLLSLVNSVLKFAWVVLALLYIFDLWGFEIGPLLAGLGIAGLAVALALQPTLANIFSGISVLLDKSVRVGDLIYLDPNTKGKILHVGLRSTRITTFDNELIIVPNSKLADSTIQNVALPEPKSRVVVPFGVAYGSDVKKVKKIVISEIKKIKHYVKDPEPSVRFIEMAESSLNFKAYFYVNNFEDRFDAIDEANSRIYNILKKNNINIPFPQIDVHLKKEK